SLILLKRLACPGYLCGPTQLPSVCRVNHDSGEKRGGGLRLPCPWIASRTRVGASVCRQLISEMDAAEICLRVQDAFDVHDTFALFDPIESGVLADNEFPAQ